MSTFPLRPTSWSTSVVGDHYIPSSCICTCTNIIVPCTLRIPYIVSCLACSALIEDRVMHFVLWFTFHPLPISSALLWYWCWTSCIWSGASYDNPTYCRLADVLVWFTGPQNEEGNMYGLTRTITSRESRGRRMRGEGVWSVGVVLYAIKVCYSVACTYVDLCVW